MKIAYISKDNMMFLTEEECKEHEKSLMPNFLSSQFYDKNSIKLKYSNLELKYIKNAIKWIYFKKRDLEDIRDILGSETCCNMKRGGLYFKEDEYFYQAYDSDSTLKILQNNECAYAHFIGYFKNKPKFIITY